MRSFLLDAGAEYNGYAADLTRTRVGKKVTTTTHSW